MNLILYGHDFHYEMEALCRLFYPLQPIHVIEKGSGFGEQSEDDPITAYTGIYSENGKIKLTASLQIGEKKETAEDFFHAKDPAFFGDEKERQLAVLLFGLLEKACGFTPRWGLLTGVRPVKLFRRLTEAYGEQKASQYFREAYLVSPEKISLASKTMHREEKILAQNSQRDFSLYLSVPFCPTRCAYCSFVSSSVEKTMKLIPEYVELLCKEIEAAAKQAEKLNLHLVSVYMGGGTPTTLTAQQLDEVLSCVKRSFDLSFCREYTVEAGRPDTITPEKLAVLKKCGADRISINPQTLNDRILEVIGRRHTAKQTKEAFLMAREAGFENINMDLIVGLPGESVESFYNTLNTLLEWAPESITVHDLALKRSSRLYQEGKIQEDAAAASVMLDYADRVLPENGYAPYYLYRQSRMVGNLENVGFAKPGFESPYNVFIMDESQHILGCGAGAVTKLCVPQKSGQRIRRIFNFKYPFEYISRHEEILERKEQVGKLS